MKKISLFLLAIFVFSAFVRAQDKLLSIDDIFDPAKRVQFGGSPTFVQWSADGSLRQVKFNPATRSAELVRINAASGTEQPFLDKSRMESALFSAGIRIEKARELANQANFVFSKGETAALIAFEGDLFLYDLRAGTAKRLTNTKDEEEEGEFSPDGKMVSFVRGNNLFVLDVATGRERQLTRDGGEKIFNGILDWIYEEEIYGRGSRRGYWWSPDSTRIAFLRIDEAPVPRFVLTDDTVTDQRVENTFYPQPGDPNPLVTLGFADVTKTSVIPNVTRIPKVGEKIPSSIARFGDVVKFADTKKYNPEDFLLVRVAWSPDSKSVVFQAQNREQSFLDVNAADLNGRVTTLFTERTKAWVGVNGDPVWLKDGSFLWQSERNGFNHLYHYSKDGRLIKQITDGRWEISNLHGVDEAGNYAYFTAIGENNDWINNHVYRVKLDGSGLQRLTQNAGMHSASFNPQFTHFVDLSSDVNTPMQTRLYRADGTLERVLNENKVEALSQYKLSRPQFLKVKTRDGFEMEAMMILPPDFDPNKKYPVLAYTYSGPHAPQVRNQWGGSRLMWHQMMAQKGYIVWVCDNRTASGKGLESTWDVYLKFGQTETQDLEDGFNYLKSLSYVDGDRLGMWGWSYGGFMTSYFMTHSKTLKAGIAGGLVSDWALYDSIYTERYMRTPQNNKEGYEKGSVLNAAKDLSGRLLIIHGAIDDNVHQQNAIKLIYELQKAGKQFEFMTYPTQRHGVANPLQQKHMYQMMTDFVLKNL